MNQTQALGIETFDLDEWQKLYDRHQQQYIRQRLDAIKLLQKGNRRLEVSQQGIVNLMG
jgi:hypothetical protein